MFKITQTNSGFLFSEILNPDLIENERLGLTNLEIEIQNSKNKSNVYLQESLPKLEKEFWKVRSGWVVDMDESDLYELEQAEIDCTFCKKNYKVTSSLPDLFKKFATVYIICKENPHITYESTRTSEDTMKSTACMDNISADMRVIVQANPTLIQLETNPARSEAVEIAEAKCRAEVLTFIEEKPEEYQAILDISELDTI